MLDLVEHVVDWSRDAPILVLCVARPELLDVQARLGWREAQRHVHPARAARRRGGVDGLADDLLADIELDGETRARILATAEGNPLFLEEMAALAREPTARVDVPPTIQALLQARLDALEPRRARRDRARRGRGSGLPPRRRDGARAGEAAVDVPRQLALARPQGAGPARPRGDPGDDAFRFRHLLIRDTAYEGLPKAVRADLHERFADWLDTTRRARRAGRDRRLPPRAGCPIPGRARSRRFRGTAVLAERAAERLGGAGRRCLRTGGLPRDGESPRRALALVDEAAVRRRLIPDLVDGLIETRGTATGLAACSTSSRRATSHDHALTPVFGRSPSRVRWPAIVVELRPSRRGAERPRAERRSRGCRRAASAHA